MKQLKSFLSILLVFFTLSAIAQDYNVSSIPDSLKTNANSVVRKYETRIVLTSDNSYKVFVEKVITVLNESGVENGHLVIVQDKSNQVKITSASVYNAKGYRIFRDPLINVNPLTYFSTSNEIVGDLNYYQVELTSKEFPYTSHFSYELTINGTLNLPTWKPVNQLFQSSQKSALEIEVFNDLNFNYRNINLNHGPVIKENKKSVSYHWQTNEIVATSNKIILSFYPEVRISLSNFSIHGESGSMATWNDFGNWLFELNNECYSLPDELKEIVHDSIDKYINKEDKIKALYSYLKSDFRYVSIQLGIGGWRPQTAEFTFKKGYGDCKALSVLMLAMLYEANIPANYCIVNSGSANADVIYPEFVENRFNHVIVCAFINDEPFWIECTSKSLEAGSIGDFTNNRWALLVEKDNSRLIKTKKETD
jgi:hypothetical protein